MPEQKVERVSIDLQKSLLFDRAILQKAAKVCNVSLERFILNAISDYIFTHGKLGKEWIKKNSTETFPEPDKNGIVWFYPEN